MGDFDDALENAEIRDFKLESSIVEDDDEFDPDDTSPRKMPERNPEISEIHRALAPVARGSSPRNRLIFGKPGQGKTASVRLKRRQMESQLADVEEVNVNFIYVSCKENPSSYDIAQSIIRKLRDSDAKPKGYQLSELYNKIYRLMDDIGGAFVIILDEVDAIRPQKSKYDQENEPNILYKFPRSNSSQSPTNNQDNIRIGIFGISNDRKFQKNLTSRCMDALGETTINFKPYNAEQLTQILMRRANRGLKATDLEITDDGEYHYESDVISEELLRECAKMAAQERGSARQALRHLGGAASIADNEDANKITKDHIRRSEEQVRKEFIKQILTDHTDDEWLALCGVLWCEANGKTPAEKVEVHNHYTSVCSALGQRAKVQRRMTERLKDLELTGAVNMAKQSGGKPGRPPIAVDLALPFKETLDVMEHKDPFEERYSDIISEIRDNAHRNGVL